MTIAVLKKSYVRDKLDPRIAEILSDRSTEALAPAWRDLKSFRSVFWRNPSIVLSTLGINLLSIALPLVMLQIYQRIIPNQASHTFAFLLLGLAFVVLLDGLLRVARSYAIAWQGARFDHLSSCQAVHRLTSASLKDFEQAPVGRHLEDLQAIDVLRDFYGGSGLINLLETPFIVVFLALIFLIGGPVGFVPLGLFVLCGAIAYFLGERLKTQIAKRNKLDMQRFNFILEVLNGLQHVKSQALEAFMQRRYERLQATAAVENCAYTQLSAMSHATGAFFSYFVLFATAAAGAYLVIEGSLSQGALAACSLLAGRATQPFLRSMAFWSEFQSVQVAERNLAKVLAIEPEAVGAATPEGDVRGRIEVEGLSMAYGDRTVFDNVNLVIEPGETVLIEGGIGAGKSTLLRLIGGVSQSTGGSIRLDGLDLKDFDPATLRREVAYMRENAVLFRGTILDNLTLFEPERHLDRAMELASALNLDHAIAKLPDGFETEVGDDLADLLPLGVRQQIAIVRALARRPRVILFDQPNGGLDLESDQRLMNLIGDIKGEATILMVTSRASYRKLADRSIVVGKDAARRDRLPPAARARIVAASSGIKVSPKAKLLQTGDGEGGAPASPKRAAAK